MSLLHACVHVASMEWYLRGSPTNLHDYYSLTTFLKFMAREATSYSCTHHVHVAGRLLSLANMLDLSSNTHTHTHNHIKKFLPQAHSCKRQSHLGILLHLALKTRNVYSLLMLGQDMALHSSLAVLIGYEGHKYTSLSTAMQYMYTNIPQLKVVESLLISGLSTYTQAHTHTHTHTLEGCMYKEAPYM